MLLELLQVLPDGPQEGPVESVRELLHHAWSDFLFEPPLALLEGMQAVQQVFREGGPKVLKVGLYQLPHLQRLLLDPFQ
jgi:hypothetical protein